MDEAASTSITSGSVKKRALLLANYVADRSNGDDGSLTPEEVQQIINSFKTNKELEEYDKYRKIHHRVQYFLSTIKIFKFSYVETLQKLDKELIIEKSRSELENYVNYVNTIVIPAVSDEQKKAAAKDELTLLFEQASQRNKKEIYDKIIKLKTKAFNELRILKTAVQVLKDYFKKTGYKVKSFEVTLKDIEKWAKNDKGLEVIKPNPSKNIQSKSRQNLGMIDQLTDQEIEEIKNNTHKIHEHNYNSIPIDETQYEYFLRDFLHG